MCLPKNVLCLRKTVMPVIEAGFLGAWDGAEEIDVPKVFSSSRRSPQVTGSRTREMTACVGTVGGRG